MQVQRDRIDWNWQGAAVRLGITRLGAGPTILMLPALSSISTRGEMRTNAWARAVRLVSLFAETSTMRAAPAES